MSQHVPRARHLRTLATYRYRAQALQLLLGRAEQEGADASNLEALSKQVELAYAVRQEYLELVLEQEGRI